MSFSSESQHRHTICEIRGPTPRQSTLPLPISCIVAISSCFTYICMVLRSTTKRNNIYSFLFLWIYFHANASKSNFHVILHDNELNPQQSSALKTKVFNVAGSATQSCTYASCSSPPCVGGKKGDKKISHYGNKWNKALTVFFAPPAFGQI